MNSQRHKIFRALSVSLSFNVVSLVCAPHSLSNSFSSQTPPFLHSPRFKFIFRIKFTEIPVKHPLSRTLLSKLHSHTTKSLTRQKLPKLSKSFKLIYCSHRIKYVKVVQTNTYTESERCMHSHTHLDRSFSFILSWSHFCLPACLCCFEFFVVSFTTLTIQQNSSNAKDNRKCAIKIGYRFSDLCHTHIHTIFFFEAQPTFKQTIFKLIFFMHSRFSRNCQQCFLSHAAFKNFLHQ